MECCNNEVTLKIEAVVVSETTWFSQKCCSHIQWKQWVRYIYPDQPFFSTQGGGNVGPSSSLKVVIL